LFDVLSACLAQDSLPSMTTTVASGLPGAISSAVGVLLRLALNQRAPSAVLVLSCGLGVVRAERTHERMVGVLLDAAAAGRLVVSGKAQC
jgi:hypothetical protein